MTTSGPTLNKTDTIELSHSPVLTSFGNNNLALIGGTSSINETVGKYAAFYPVSSNLEKYNYTPVYNKLYGAQMNY